MAKQQRVLESIITMIPSEALAYDVGITEAMLGHFLAQFSGRHCLTNGSAGGSGGGGTMGPCGAVCAA